MNQAKKHEIRPGLDFKSVLIWDFTAADDFEVSHASGIIVNRHHMCDITLRSDSKFREYLKSKIFETPWDFLRLQKTPWDFLRLSETHEDLLLKTFETQWKKKLLQGWLLGGIFEINPSSFPIWQTKIRPGMHQILWFQRNTIEGWFLFSRLVQQMQRKKIPALPFIQLDFFYDGAVSNGLYSSF